MNKIANIGSDINIILFLLNAIAREKELNISSISLKNKLEIILKNEIAGMKFFNLELRRN
ncbi:MAG: hypothetical protein HYS24_12985 [Ignavibacteriales bacterium]|nr:hypothetical protein [Ignavibacteriales bacterium]